MNTLHCRSCGEALHLVFADLGVSPLSNSYLEADELNAMEPFYPLTVRVCDHCWLVQLPQVVTPRQIFSDYAYFSSYSDSWLKHSETFAEMIVTRLGLGGEHRVVELASNDGYLLQYFTQRGIPVLGVEPAANVAAAAEQKGIPTIIKFFGVETAEAMVRAGLTADLLIGNNVLAHVPDLNDFIAGMKHILKPGGVLTMEFPHLQHLLELNQFDTIYHEHFSYFSFIPVETAFRRHGLEIFDVEEIQAHGGSLRIYGKHIENEYWPISPRVEDLRARERIKGYDRAETYARFTQQMEETKAGLLSFLIETKRAGKRVVGYGAPAKGNTLLNYCGIRTDFLEYTVDRSEHKQGLFLPGSHIPIHAPEHIRETMPDYVLILPWNLREEIMEQMADIRAWGGRFVVPIPKIEILT